MTRPDVVTRAEMDELRNVVETYPVWPGGTLSHATARRCAERGWIKRQHDGCWIPTAAGLLAYDGGQTT